MSTIRVPRRDVLVNERMMMTKALEDWMDAITKQIGRNKLTPGVGDVLASAPTITPTHAVHHVSGTETIETITASGMAVGESLVLIPDEAFFTTDTGGNIALATSAVVSMALTLTWDGFQWFPNYQ